MPNPVIIDTEFADEKVIVNDRNTIRFKKSRKSDIEDSEMYIVRALVDDPEQFVSKEFVETYPKIKHLSDEIQKQESALISETSDPAQIGKIKVMERETEKIVSRHIKEFTKMLSKFASNVEQESVVKIKLPSGSTFNTLHGTYKELFSNGRWLEILSYGILNREIKKLTERYIMKTDVEILGRSGMWHETDILLMTRDVSSIFEVKSGRWGRSDLLKVIAQREDIGCDIGVLLAWLPPSENYENVSKAHRVISFTFADDGLDNLKNWAREVA